MKEKKKVGSSIVQYIIIIALIALALIPILLIFGSNIVSSLKLHENNLSDIKNQSKINAALQGGSDSVQAGSFGGTEEKPVTSCINGTCDIDFGKYILKGVPENFQEFVESNSSSGGTDKLVSLMHQIADQLEAEGDLAGAAEFRNVANLSHYVAELQKDVENVAETCQLEADPVSCMVTKVEETNPKTVIPDNIQSLLSGYNPDKPFNQTIRARSFLTSDIQKARMIQATDPTAFKNGKDSIASYALIDSFDKILNNNSYSNSLKGVAISLVKEVAEISNNQASYTKAINNTGGTGNASYDVITGVETSTNTYTTDSTDIILKPQTSVTTNFDAVLICAAGYNKDSGYNCN